MVIIDNEGAEARTILSGPLTHAKLVKCGRDWLRGKGCNPVFTEKLGGFDEIPDVIGWDGQNCWVLECKMSVEDYRADQHKPHRHREKALGNRRLYVVDVALQEKIVDDTGWGLIVVKYSEGDLAYARQVRGRGGKEFNRDLDAEVQFLRRRIMDVQDYGLSRDIR